MDQLLDEHAAWGWWSGSAGLQTPPTVDHLRHAHDVAASGWRPWCRNLFFSVTLSQRVVRAFILTM